MTDTSTTVAELRDVVRQFVDQRDWRQFHNPKNLSMSIAIEAAELMELFQWIDGRASDDLRGDADAMQRIREELSDVLAFALSLANALDIDVSDALREKMRSNAVKYPAEKFRGRFK